MSRYRDHSDDDSDEAVLARGRWEHNARAVLRSKRGRKALAELLAALMALPEHRLIEGALCTVGTVDQRAPEITDEEIHAEIAASRAWRAEHGWDPVNEASEAWREASLRESRQLDREELTASIERQGCGVCVNGALLWWRNVQKGMTQDEAFAALPTLLDRDDSDMLTETAELATSEVGVAYTLAWELAYRNDEIYSGMTPEQRWEAFTAWISRLLGEQVEAARRSA